MEDSNYRTRIYDYYNKTRDTNYTISIKNELENRGPYIKNIINKYFPIDKNAKILDLGCGYGAFLHYSHQMGYENTIGIDCSKDQIECSIKLGISGIEQGNLLEKLNDLEESSLDCVITFDVIEHFRKDELLHLLDEIYRTLKSNGIWIIHAPNGDSPFGGRIRYGDYTHEQMFTQNSLAQIVLSSGFTKLDFFEDQPIPHNIKSSIRLFLWKMIHSSLYFYNLIEIGDSNKKAIFSQNFLTIVNK